MPATTNVALQRTYHPMPAALRECGCKWDPRTNYQGGGGNACGGLVGTAVRRVGGPTHSHEQTRLSRSSHHQSTDVPRVDGTCAIQGVTEVRKHAPLPARVEPQHVLQTQSAAFDAGRPSKVGPGHHPKTAGGAPKQPTRAFPERNPKERAPWNIAGRAQRSSNVSSGAAAACIHTLYGSAVPGRNRKTVVPDPHR